MLTETSSLQVLIQTAHAPVINLIAPDKAQATTTIHEWIRGVTPIDAPGLDVHKGDSDNQEFYGIYYDDIPDRRRVEVHPPAIRPHLFVDRLCDGRCAYAAVWSTALLVRNP